MKKLRIAIHASLSRQFIFSVSAAVLMIFVIGVILGCSLFLVSSIRKAFSDEGNANAPVPVRFDIKGFEKLQLTK